MSGVTRMSLSQAPTQWSWISSKDAILSLEDKKTLRSFTVNILWISLNYLVILIERSSHAPLLFLLTVINATVFMTFKSRFSTPIWLHSLIRLSMISILWDKGEKLMENWFILSGVTHYNLWVASVYDTTIL